MGVYLNHWHDLAGMCANFEIEEAELEPYDVLLASYDFEGYEGFAFVLLRDRRDGKLYEVNGGHCSCCDLEGQWDVEETTIESLRHRLSNGDRMGLSYEGENVYADELAAVLAEMEGQ